MMLAERWIILFLLGLLELADTGQCSPGNPMWRYISSEVVIPRKDMHEGKGVAWTGWLSYNLHFGGQRHIIHVQSKKLLWSRNMLMTTQDDQGALQMDYPYIPTDCYYMGYLEDIPLSTITVNTCHGGLEGIMKLDDLVYEIKPLQDSRRFEHVVSQIVADRSATGPTYTLQHRKDFVPFFHEVNDSMTSRISSFNYLYHHAQLKGQIQFTNELFRVFGNISKCVEFGINMFSIVDSFLRSVAFRYYIAIITVYDRQDPVPTNDFRVPGSDFHLYYRDSFYTPFSLSTSTVLRKDTPQESEVVPELNTACLLTSLVFASVRGRHYFLMAIVSAHQHGRMLGIKYDGPYCSCQRRTTCLMQQLPELTDSFSNCSFASLQDSVLNDRTFACYYLPSILYINKTLVQDRCGNSIVDAQEDCDCGSFKQCYSNECCRNDCRFTPGSICDKQQCCVNCTYSPSGTMCRPVRNICDLPEYCSGSSYTCPDNFYLQDGTPCTEEGFCYKGNCSDRNVHCKEIFGDGAMNAPVDCYDINTQRFRFGNCGRLPHRQFYYLCDGDNKLCGRLQCINISRIPYLHEHESFHQSVYGRKTCFGLDEHRAMGLKDRGQVREGTPCGIRRYCLQRQCSARSALFHYDCSPQKCNYRGMCNNRKNCHCRFGWEPPQCLKAGAGGSSDSGPPPRRLRLITSSLEPVFYWRVILGRLYFVIWALLFGVATNVRLIKTTVVKEAELPKPEELSKSEVKDTLPEPKPQD
ncbi:disintegrin and metalloproteinase domain-containing protein 20-like [Ochotona princeps]|uniref:disintegrin and metalloproteinase domain-containing protein 20-like n=1 Tax=Ochotona princeps TaxID=9978 RepID=UPI002714905B|nr:disintegrin and metalloproteinase domain-containing protein 20-like [Ochotona princeps]